MHFSDRNHGVQSDPDQPLDIKHLHAWVAHEIDASVALSSRSRDLQPHLVNPKLDAPSSHGVPPCSFCAAGASGSVGDKGKAVVQQLPPVVPHR